MDTIYVIQDGALPFIVFRKKLANHSFSPRAKVSVERYRVPTIRNSKEKKKRYQNICASYFLFIKTDLHRMFSIKNVSAVAKERDE